MKGNTRIALATALALLLGSSPSVWAKTLSVTNAQAQGRNKLTSVKVWPGYGLNLSFIETGESIIKAWLDDPSRLAMDLDGKDGVAAVVHLRRIKIDQSLPLMTSQDGATLLTVITESERGRKLYQIRVIAADGAPDYYAVNVEAVPRAREMAQLPRSGKRPKIAKAVLPNGQDTANLTKELAKEPRSAPEVVPEQSASFQVVEALQIEPKAPVSAESPKKAKSPKLPVIAQKEPVVRPDKQNSAQSLDDANAAVYGLMVAHQKAQIKRGTKTWQKVQTAIIWLRRGKTREAAAKLADVKLSKIEQVIAWGQSRPGQRSQS
ncbi:MAG: hypothetical protein MH252_05985 [Thermosynechococcaceae cyanobacterium MS004]|nr:hypothetical protein [Thermosynechococcaceae cyanobacterium MS004]